MLCSLLRLSCRKNVEKYLLIDLNFVCRKSLANIRCSSHNSLIEKRRRQQFEREYRICPFCLERNVYSVEDKFHFYGMSNVYLP